MKATIGKYTILDTQTLLVPPEQEIWLESTVLNWELKIKIIFIFDTENPDDTGYSIYGEEDYGVIALKNWTSSAMSFPEPIQLGTNDDGRPVFTMIFGQTVQKITRLEVQFYKETES